MRRAKALVHGLGELLHLRRIGHIHTPRQHLAARGNRLGFGGVKGVLLHIDQYQVHAALHANARALQAETRTSACQNGGLACEVFNHVSAFLST